MPIVLFGERRTGALKRPRAILSEPHHRIRYYKDISPDRDARRSRGSQGEFMERSGKVPSVTDEKYRAGFCQTEVYPDDTVRQGHQKFAAGGKSTFSQS